MRGYPAPLSAPRPSGIDGRAAAAPVEEGVAVLFAVLLVPAALYAVGLSAPLRFGYPALNFALAGYLFARRSPWYATHCLLIFCFVSLVRRLVDESQGFEASNPILLTPYLCCLFCGISFVEYWSRRRPTFLGPFLVIFGCVAYGTALAVLDGRVLSSLVDVMKWTVGPLFAVHLLSRGAECAETRRLFENTLVIVGPLLGLYGVWQFLQPPGWDVVWMKGARELGFESVGIPEPFRVRVFSTLNSPGSFGTILMAAIVLSLKRRTLWCLLALAPMLAGVALCQYRSIWAMTLLGILMVALSPSRELRRGNLVAMVVVAMLLATSALAPRVQEIIFARASSLSSLEDDHSLKERIQQYRDFLSNDNLVVGEGLALVGASRRLDNRETGILDGAVLIVYTAMGVFIGTAFMLAIATVVGGLFGAAAQVNPHIWFDRAIVLTLFLQFPIGNVHVGELGFCAWTFIGLSLAARRIGQETP